MQHAVDTHLIPRHLCLWVHINPHHPTLLQPQQVAVCYGDQMIGISATS
jgi:hypothetical protein